MLELNRLYNIDCMEGMAQMPDKFFDLAIVDPPYGGGCNAATVSDTAGMEKLQGGATPWDKRKRSRFGGQIDKYDITAARTGGTWAGKYETDIKHWDVAPPPEYFEALARVSKHQIIWGGNYFGLPPTRCFIVWHKINIPLQGFSMAPVEYAWTSFNANAAMCQFFSNGGNGREERFHPTQKPVALYAWLLERFAKPGWKILDTHAGSASSLVACHRLGYEYMGFEVHEGYYAKATQRLAEEQAQISLLSTALQERQTTLWEEATP